ncbi:hypothetical protein A3844_01665 [Paenibacillus helianthi]|uniref:DUF3168 domain-containing protein n=1 Tax=Paenibacillus helianthi TaxID=1349432 RepID=A0ABX3EUH4_9BACL|nr:minor capsid protein [Paenibacillus helianthi]OKP91847.1 hypothetical protein A3844_01665 [Paenibacillus helianthi]
MLANELISYLTTAGYTVYPDANFIPADLPETKLPCLFVMDSSGPPPDMYVPTERTAYQIIVKGKSYKTLPSNMAATEALAKELGDLLHRKPNYMIGSTYVFASTETMQPIYLGQDINNHPMYSTNFEFYVKEV